MQHRRKPASAAAPAVTKPPPSRRPTAPLSLAGLVVVIFLVAVFLYNDDAVKPTETVAVAGRARSPDLRVLHQQHDEDVEVEDQVVRDGDANHKQAQTEDKQAETTEEKHQQQQVVVRLPAGCDLYQGRWTYDAAGERSPLYRESECEFLTEQVTCMRNGRRDDSYQKWRWQPHGCDLPRFDASLLLERLRNKRLMFVGDSLNRNQWESMVCLVQSVVPTGQKTLQKFVNNGSLNVFTAHVRYGLLVNFAAAAAAAMLTKKECARRSTTPPWSSTGRPSWSSPTRTTPRCTASWTVSSPGAPSPSTPTTGRASTTSSSTPTSGGSTPSR
ncbi:hypothetical protein SEVIR_2G455100v4 [Setaria viridis]